MTTTQFEPWQLVTVHNVKGDPIEFVVYDTDDREGQYHHVRDIKNNHVTTVSDPHLHGAHDYNLEDTGNLRFGCKGTELNCQTINSFRPHIQAVIAFLRKKQEFERQDVEYSEYIIQLIHPTTQPVFSNKVKDAWK